MKRIAEDDEMALASPAWEEALAAADPTAPENRLGAPVVVLVALAALGVVGRAPLRPTAVGVTVELAGLVPGVLGAMVELAPGALAGPDR